MPGPANQILTVMGIGTQAVVRLPRMTKSATESERSAGPEKRTAIRKITYACLSDQGQTRSVNEDRCMGESAMGLYIVADGIGSSSGGGQAAQLVVEELPVALRRQLRGVRDLADPRADDRVRAALVELNGVVVAESELQSESMGMGSTVVCALVWERQALIAHKGDSRAYLFRNGDLVQLTKDHSRVQQLIDRGLLTPEQATRHPDSEQLTCCVGMRSEPSPDTWYLDLESKDLILLCTDGLSKMLKDAEIRGILDLRLPPKDLCRLLVDAANLAGGSDNVTVVVIAVNELPAAKR
jgi:protein phosphatase